MPPVTSIIKELEILCKRGSRNTFIDRYYAFHNRLEILFNRAEYEAILFSFLEQDSFINRTLTPESLMKIDELAQKLSFSQNFRNRLDCCRSNIVKYPELKLLPGQTSLLLADSGTGKGYIAEMQIRTSDNVCGAGTDSHPLLIRAASLIQKFCRRQNLPEFSLNPDRYVCGLLTTNDPAKIKFEEITGSSLGLPLLLALFSCICKEPLPIAIAASAELGPAGELLPVGDIEAKIAALQAERYYVKRILVAAEQKCEICPPEIEICRYRDIFTLLSELFPPKICAGIDLVLDVDKTIALIEDEYDRQQREICIANATALINSAATKMKKGALFSAFSCRGAAHCHRGEIGPSRRDFNTANKIYKRSPQLIDDHQYFDMRNRTGVALKDVFRYREAREIHEENCREFVRLGANAVIRAANISSLSQLSGAMGEYSEAIKLQKEALKLLRQSGEDLARNYGYLADIQTRAGNFERAKSALAKAREYPEGQSNSSGSGRSVPFLDWFEAQLLYRQLEKSRKRKRFFLQKLQHLREAHPEVTFHAPAMLHKFVNLGELLCRDQAALNRLDELIDFLSAQADSTYHLLAATVRIERQIILLAAGNNETIILDIDNILLHLQVQLDIERFFRPQIKILKTCRQKSENSFPEKQILTKITKVLHSLQEKIPY